MYIGTISIWGTEEEMKQQKELRQLLHQVSADKKDVEVYCGNSGPSYTVT